MNNVIIVVILLVVIFFSLIFYLLFYPSQMSEEKTTESKVNGRSKKELPNDEVIRSALNPHYNFLTTQDFRIEQENGNYVVTITTNNEYIAYQIWNPINPTLNGKIRNTFKLNKNKMYRFLHTKRIVEFTPSTIFEIDGKTYFTVIVNSKIDNVGNLILTCKINSFMDYDTKEECKLPVGTYTHSKIYIDPGTPTCPDSYPYGPYTYSGCDGGNPFLICWNSVELEGGPGYPYCMDMSGNNIPPPDCICTQGECSTLS